MTHASLKGKKIAVFGFGVEGVSSAEYLLTHGADVTVFDERDEEALDADLRASFKQKGVSFVCGKDAFARWHGADILVRTPGIRRSLPEILAAEAEGVQITSHMQIFFDLCPAKIIGVTGTKGKGTTSTLIYEMLKAEGMRAYLGGNIGTPPCTFLDELTADDRVVLELSSFQLEDLTTSPHMAVMLMVTSEHLAADQVGTANYHDSLDAYISAKQRILAFQTPTDIAILNEQYPATWNSRTQTKAMVYRVSQNEVEVGDGCFVRGGSVWIRVAGKEERVIDVEKIALLGAHNRENVCAASMAAFLSGVSLDHIRGVLEAFSGLEHRLQRIAEVHGVTYYDDSFSTTPETTIAAIAAFEAPLVLILGGSTKGSDFSALATQIAAREDIRAIIGIGAEWERIKEALKPHAKEIPVREGLKDMSSIVKAAADVAKPGDVVLLSPACASFGLFPNYKVRGELFAEHVRQLNEIL